MKFSRIDFEDLGVRAEYSQFSVPNGVAEWHVMLHVDPKTDLFIGQMQRIYAAEDRLPGLPAFAGARYVMKRYFLSDSANQQPLMRHEPGVSLSLIQQQPLDGSKIAVWLYLQAGTDIRPDGDAVATVHNGYTHLWHMGMTCPEGDSAQQTRTILEHYETELGRQGATLAENCVRTWFFVRDVDTQYHGLVVARRENFEREGLTSHTHYIASTGIGGSPADTRALVQLGSLAVLGLHPRQQRYLYAPTHLNPTYEYGVTFERGTAVSYGDRSHIYISGTASINNKGQVMHVGDVVAQTRRMWENVETLLAEAGASFADVMQIIVYLRDTADAKRVTEMFHERFPNIPTVVTLAPVCRPTWLIEMECIAVRPASNPEFRPF
ncbi:MAG: Rid family hydrolase [Bacteroidaceae bacterium]|nr:Rid family hydrolase [Bacteroidaceae bacterium]